MLSIGLFALTCWPIAAQPAAARRHADFAYPLSRVWTSVVRLLRVDLESPIREKDREDGYFLFEYPHAGRSHSGSVEVVSLRNAGDGFVRVYVQVSDLPSYVERMMLTRLEKKLAAEYGPPAGGSLRVAAGPLLSEAPSPGEAQEAKDDAKGDASTGATESARP